MSEEDAPVVLIVEDEPELVHTYRAGLEGEYNIRTATDGETALEQVDEDVDVILLDRRMPGMSGDEVLERVRDRELGCRVVMVTAVDPDTDLLDLEFDEYLVKPVTTEDLTDAIERMLARNEMEERIQEMFALASKLATLEAKLDLEQQERSEKHKQLLDEFYALREELEFPGPEDDYYSDAALDKFQALIESRAQE